MAAGTHKAITCLNRRMGLEGRKPLLPLLHLKGKWEADLSVDIPDKTWDKLVERAWKSSRNARFQLIHFFVLHRAYLTPAGIAKYFNIVDAHCPRCSLGGAEFAHMLWDCPSLGLYWEEVVLLLRTITDRTLELSMGVCCIGSLTLSAQK